MPSMTVPGAVTDRRVALKLLASAVAATMTRCARPQEPIIPYADMPEGRVPGEPIRFATTLALSGYGRGFLGVSVDGRPIKIEGNPRHPFSLGATDVFAEAEVLSLYDPDRSRVVRHGEAISTWDDFTANWERACDGVSSDRVALVTGRIVSPTTLERIDALKARFPNLRWYRYEPVNDDNARAGARQAFGRVVTALPRWTEADVVLSLGDDPLGHGPGQMRNARGFAARRKLGQRQRIHVIESAWTLTGAAADHRLTLHPSLIREVARAVAKTLGLDLGEPALGQKERAFVDGVTRELANARGRALVLAGEAQSAEVHALCHWINGALQAPVDYLASPDPVENDHAAALGALADDLHAKRITALLILDANPVYDAPDALHVADAIAAVPFSVHLGQHRDETALRCGWHLPLSHALESWGDVRAPDGTASLVQPLIQRLHDTRTRDEVLTLFAGEPNRSAYDLTRDAWRSKGGADFETWWRRSLNDGVIADTRAAPVGAVAARPTTLSAAEAPYGLTLLLAPDASVWDGRFANNAWLQECPKPFTKEVWGNAVVLAPGDAARLGVVEGDAVAVESGGRGVSGPAVIMPTQAEGVVMASLGQGRSATGRMGNGVGSRYGGFAGTPLARRVEGITLTRNTAASPFRSTQAHTQLAGRTEDLFATTTPAELAKPPAPKEKPASLLAKPARGDYAWSMVIDMDACIGCNACVVACQAENNVPIVGPEEIGQGRDMHWLRVDTYARTEGEAQRRGFQPVPCMHCELAPCEPVCPVEASVHDREGLNVQVYNRCIGTRFCEANCPYKVRRFNWFAYADGQAYGGDDESAALKAQHNPDVSARSRGVMEKCNYCLQRVSRARKTAEKEDRTIAEGEVVTACQAACPTNAIHFGDLNRAESDVSRLKRDKRGFVLLAELNTRPRTTYLKRVYDDQDEPG